MQIGQGGMSDSIYMFPSTGFNEKENECFVAFTAYRCVGYATCVI